VQTHYADSLRTQRPAYARSPRVQTPLCADPVVYARQAYARSPRVRTPPSLRYSHMAGRLHTTVIRIPRLSAYHDYPHTTTIHISLSLTHLIYPHVLFAHAGHPHTMIIHVPRLADYPHFYPHITIICVSRFVRMSRLSTYWQAVRTRGPCVYKSHSHMRLSLHIDYRYPHTRAIRIRA
jgi:hypothetical protein